MQERLAYVVTCAKLSGIAFIFELKYHPKYEKVLTKLILYFQIIGKCHVNLNFLAKLGTQDTARRLTKQITTHKTKTMTNTNPTKTEASPLYSLRLSRVSSQSVANILFIDDMKT